jgi:hypothetical protein
MAACAHCKTQETGMYENGVPVCLACTTDIAAKVNRFGLNPAHSMVDGAGSLPKDLKRDAEKLT